MVYDNDRNGAIIEPGVGRSLSHIEVSEEANTAVLGWMDADIFGPLDLASGNGPLVEHPGMWDIDTTPDARFTASVTSPVENPGSVGIADNEGTVLWETPFENATGQSVAISDDGNHIAVGAGHYWEDGIDPIGQPGIRLYNGDGTELWKHDHGEDVLSVGVDNERELVIAGTDDGLTIVLDFEGNVVWETDEFGGWVVLSDDGGTIVSSELDGLFAVDTATGDERWTTEIGMWAAEDISVSSDGSRVLATDRGNAEFIVVEEGETIWSGSYDIGPGRGDLSGDGNTWSVILTHLEEEMALVEGYRIAEPKPNITTVDAALNPTEVEIGELITVEATLENDGNADGAHTVQLLVNGEVADESDVDVAAGESETVTFNYTLEERGEFEVAVDDIVAGRVQAVNPNLRTVVDFDWSDPDCPDKEVGELEKYFFGDISLDGFHLDEGDGAAKEADSCVLRSDGNEVAVTSLPDGHDDQPEPLEYYPARGETIRFEHYVHRRGTNKEFRFGVQEDESYYAVRLETEEDVPALELRRVDEGVTTELDRETDFAFSAPQWHEFEIDWRDEIVVSLDHPDGRITISALDDTHEQGGIGFYKQHTGLVRSYAHLWDNVEVIVAD